MFIFFKFPETKFFKVKNVKMLFCFRASIYQFNKNNKIKKGT